MYTADTWFDFVVKCPHCGHCVSIEAPGYLMDDTRRCEDCDKVYRYEQNQYVTDATI